MKNILMIYYDGFPVYRTKRYGGQIDTPHFDNLISRSKFYENVCAAAPSTAMSLTSMFTGLFVHEFGRRSYSVSDSTVGNLPDGTVSLFPELEKLGYEK